GRGRRRSGWRRERRTRSGVAEEGLAIVVARAQPRGLAARARARRSEARKTRGGGEGGRGCPSRRDGGGLRGEASLRGLEAREGAGEKGEARSRRSRPDRGATGVSLAGRAGRPGVGAPGRPCPARPARLRRGPFRRGPGARENDRERAPRLDFFLRAALETLLGALPRRRLRGRARPDRGARRDQ